MKRLSLAALALLCACGTGNWSNKDLEFLNALPTREALESKLPTGTAGGLSGPGTRRDGLSVGEPSQLYVDTRNASNQFNGILEFVIVVIETVRQLPPSARTPTSRTWGPWADKQNPGFDFQVVITQVDAQNFAYAFQERATGGDFFDTVTGAFRATADLHRGEGSLVVHAKDIVARLPSAKDFNGLDQIDIGYVTDMFPTLVDMHFTFAVTPTGTLSEIGYTYREQLNKSGLIHFAVRGTSLDISELDTTSQWLPGGNGKAVSTVAAGNYKGATQAECWDAAFNLTWAKQSWPGGVEVGDPATCVDVPGF